MSTATKLVTLLLLITLPARTLGAQQDEKEKPKGYIGVKISWDEDAKEATIDETVDDGPAQKAGVKAGDVVVKLDGKKFDDVQEFVKQVGAHKPGDTLTLTVKRDGKEKDIKVTVGKKPPE